MRLIFSFDSAILITQHKNNLGFNGPVPALVRVFYAARLKIRLNIVFGIKKNPETILSPFTGTQTVTPMRGSGGIRSLILLPSYAGHGMTSLSGGSSFGCFSSGCMALSTVPMSR